MIPIFSMIPNIVGFSEVKVQGLPLDFKTTPTTASMNVLLVKCCEILKKI